MPEVVTSPTVSAQALFWCVPKEWVCARSHGIWRLHIDFCVRYKFSLLISVLRNRSAEASHTVWKIYIKRSGRLGIKSHVNQFIKISRFSYYDISDLWKSIIISRRVASKSPERQNFQSQTFSYQVYSVNRPVYREHHYTTQCPEPYPV